MHWMNFVRFKRYLGGKIGIELANKKRFLPAVAAAAFNGHYDTTKWIFHLANEDRKPERIYYPAYYFACLGHIEETLRLALQFVREFAKKYPDLHRLTERDYSNLDRYTDLVLLLAKLNPENATKFLDGYQANGHKIGLMAAAFIDYLRRVECVVDDEPFEEDL
jgi:hypothetical protein